MFPKPEWAESLGEADIEELQSKVDSDHSPLTPPDAIDPTGVTVGKWRLVKDDSGSWKLFDLKVDPEMRNDLSQMKPRVRSQMVNVHLRFSQ